MYIPTVHLPHPIRRSGIQALLLAWAIFPATRTHAGESSAAPKVAIPGTAAPAARTFRAFLPRPGTAAEEPRGHVIQLLLDRQEKDGYESYLIQVLFRGSPAREYVHRVYPDRVEVDFFDAGKPTMRLARIRGGAVEATSLEALHYRDADKLKSLVRLTLYIRERPALRIRSTLDRTLIHFRLERTGARPSENSPESVPPIAPRP
jgi:hypothetical protein